MQWGYGDLSLIKGVITSDTGFGSKRSGKSSSRRVLCHIMFDMSVRFVPRQQKRLNRMRVNIKVD